VVCGDNAAADELFADAARRDEHAGAAALVVRDLQRHGELLHAADRRQRADQLLHTAAEKARSIGLNWPPGAGEGEGG
jgi:hypothetical protein